MGLDVNNFWLSPDLSGHRTCPPAVSRAVKILPISIRTGSNTRLELQTLMNLSIGIAGKAGQMHSKAKGVYFLVSVGDEEARKAAVPRATANNTKSIV